MGEEAAKSISDELGDMIAGFEAKEEEEEKTKKTKGEAEEEVEEKEEKEEEKEEEEAEEEAEEGELEEDEEGEEEEEKVDESSEEMADLKAKIIRLESLIESSIPTKKEEDRTDVSVKYEDVDFVGDADIATMVDSKEGLNKFANAVLKKATELVNQGVEKTLLAVPGLAVRQLSNAAKLNKIVSGFYEEHKDLVKYKAIVGAMINKITSENPGYKLEKVLKEAADETRKALNLKKVAADKTKDKHKTNPAFSKQSGKRTSSGKRPGLKGVQKEIDDLIE